jgi:hypothetical protein
MHDVQTDSRRGLPSTMARTLCTLGYQRLFVRLCEWLMLMPTDGRLPQTSQTAAIEVERIPADREGAVPGTGIQARVRAQSASRVSVSPSQYPDQDRPRLGRGWPRTGRQLAPDGPSLDGPLDELTE